jgi:hypothetical protein
LILLEVFMVFVVGDLHEFGPRKLEEHSMTVYLAPMVANVFLAIAAVAMSRFNPSLTFQCRPAIDCG